jgi:beta-phosphoglucomutase
MIKTSIKAILFDLDGVLVDACDWHYHALNGALKKNCGITINRKDHEETFNGIPTKKKLEILEGRKLILRESFEKIWSDKQEYTKQAIENFASKDLEKNINA